MSRNTRKIPLTNNPAIALTMGDPKGIGPEIVLECLRKKEPRVPFLIITPPQVIPETLAAMIADPFQPEKPGYFQMALNDLAPEASFAMVSHAADLALSKSVAGIVTGPISKEKWHSHGIPYSGHTDFLARHAGCRDCAMMFWSEEFLVALYTVHIPLRDVFSSIRRDRIVAFVRNIDRELKKWFGRSFSFLFCGLNPHSGETGTMGTEEAQVILPALDILRNEVSIAGMLPPDTAFLPKNRSKDRVVVCWYHDQGLIPFKLLHFRDGVNITLGLPYIRTSPDHGTAFDIVGMGKADSASMMAAMNLAEDLVIASGNRETGEGMES